MKYANINVENAFKADDYHRPLEMLEQSFNAAHLGIEFVGIDDIFLGKIVSIKRDGGRFVIRRVMIEGDSPAQAVKDVAKAVRL